MTVADWLADAALAPPVSARCAPFHDAAAVGRVVLPCCRACATPMELDQVACHRCAAAEPVWEEVPPIGQVHSVSVVHRVAPPQILTDSPYLLIDVEFHSGHRLVLTTTVPWQQPPAVGRQVRIGFRRLGVTPLPAVDLDDAC